MTAQAYYGWYSKQSIPTPVKLESSAPIPELVLLPERNVKKGGRKNHRRKIELINEYGYISAHCNNIKEIGELTRDHIQPRFNCPKKSYNMKENWQLLCKKCHRMKSRIEQSFLGRLHRRVIDHIIRNNLYINISEIVEECKRIIYEWVRETRLPILFNCIL